MSGNVGKIIAGCFALAAFSVAIMAGMKTGNPASAVLARALIAMVVCYPCGWIVGTICQRVVDDHVEAHEQANPAPDSSIVDAGVQDVRSPEDETVLEV